MFKRLLVTTLLGVAGLATAIGPAGAAPTNSKNTQTIAVDCGVDGTFQLLVLPSAAVVFDPVASDGRAHALLSLEGRSFTGTFATEPATTPDFTFEKQWGNRHGYAGDPMSCSA